MTIRRRQKLEPNRTLHLFTTSLRTTTTKPSTMPQILYKNIMLLPVITLVLLAAASIASGLQGDISNDPSQARSFDSATDTGNKFNEILVQPDTNVRLKCQLPNESAASSSSALINTPNQNSNDQSADKSGAWLFQSSIVGPSSLPTHSVLLFFRNICYFACSDLVELDSSRETGTYDLVINNITYENNDGLYYCDYKDTNKPNKQPKQLQIYKLTVLIPPQAPSIVQSSPLPAREGLEHQLQCSSHGGNPEPNITWYRNEQPLVTGTNLIHSASAIGSQQQQTVRIEQTRTVNGTTISTLTWIAQLDDHQSIYRCAVWNKAMGEPVVPYERELRLQVEYAPRITVGPFNPLKVLQNVPTTLSCQVDANPPVKGIRWFRDGRPISNHYNHTLPETHLNDAGLYSCQADNGVAPVSALNAINAAAATTASATAVEAQLNLQVLYAPRVHIKPTKSMPLNDGEPFGLNCTAEAWPPVNELIWTKSDDPTFRRVSQINVPPMLATSSSLNPPVASSFLEFAGANANDMANYTCTAYNRLEPSPATSSPSYLSYRQPASSQPLERHSSASVLVLVRHKPGAAEIQAGIGGQTELGARTHIECRARPPGYPEPQYRFWKSPTGSQQPRKELPSSKSSHGPVYTIYSAKADDEAHYGCVASNEFGSSSEAEAELVVNEPPVIINDNTVSMAMMRQDEDERMPGDHPYSITVRATGKPEPKVTWWHRSPIDGRRIDLNSAEAKQRVRIDTIVNSEPLVESLGQKGSPSTNRKRYNVFATLTFLRPLEVDDRGLYTVEFDNGLTRSASKDFRLHIEHKPVPAVHRSHPVLAGGRSSSLLLSNTQQQHAASASSASSSTQNGSPTSVRMKAGFEPGDSVNLTCRVSAHPRPEFTWYTQDSSVIGTNSRYHIDVSNPIDDIWESTLSFPHASLDDFGEYMCTAANMDRRTSIMGKEIQILISMQRRSAPDAPTQLEPIDSSQDSVTLQWLPGFDGGFAHNDYIVQYAPDDGSSVPMSRRYQSADTMYAVDTPTASNELGLESGGSFPKLYDCLSMNPCTISQLSPKQAYVFRVRSRNKLGVSPFTDETRASTRANMSHVPKISDASFDSTRNVLYFRVDPSSDYLLNQLQARIEVRAPSNTMVDNTSQLSASMQDQTETEWRLNSIVPIRNERAEAYLNMAAGSEQLRITLCSRSNETLCGADYVVSLRSAASSFLQDQRGLSLSIMVSTLTLIVVLGALATTMHSCCLSRKAKKLAALGRGSNGDLVVSSNGSIANALMDGKKNQANGSGPGSGTGSTVSTNSTSANGGAANGLQSMDSVLTGGASMNGGGANGASDHSSDHSRQAKMDSLLPPNYNHYADRASLMFEKQQQQQQQQMGGDKSALGALGSPFGLPSSMAIMQQQPQASPMTLPNGAFTYGHLASMDQQQQQQSAIMFDPTNSSNNPMDMQMMADQQPLAPTGAAPPHHLWSHHHHQMAHDDYGTHMGSYATGVDPASVLDAAMDHQQQQQQQQQMVDPTYGTSQAIAQQSAAYDNTANSSQQYRSYLSSSNSQDANAQYQQYQQEIAAAQQQMYGTLTRTNTTDQYSNNGNNHHITSQQDNQHDDNSLSDMQQQQLDQQQQHYITTNGLMGPPPPPMSTTNNVESDYGVVGGAGRSGRLIREIIV